MNALSPSEISEVRSFFNTVAEQVASLAWRWADEREYEDITDYRKVLEKNLPEGLKIVKMTKRPFGFIFSNARGVQFKIACTTGGRVSISTYRQRAAA